jgi:hypothetical protein
MGNQRNHDYSGTGGNFVKSGSGCYLPHFLQFWRILYNRLLTSSLEGCGLKHHALTDRRQAGQGPGNRTSPPASLSVSMRRCCPISAHDTCAAIDGRHKAGHDGRRAVPPPSLLRTPGYP